MNAMKRNSIILAGVVILDQLLKFCVALRVPQIDLGLVYFHLVKNTGASFGILKGNNTLLIWVSLIAIGAIMMNVKSIKGKYELPLSLITAGILGNLIDRIFRGYVVDFIDLKLWPVFNVADSAIFIGVFWTIVLLIQDESEPALPAKSKGLKVKKSPVRKKR